MTAPWNVGKICDAFVEAAIDSERWNAAMQIAAEQTGSFGALLVPYRGKLPNAPHTRSLIPSFEAYVRDGWIHRDDRYAAVPMMIRTGVVTDFDFTTAEEMRQRAYYQEFLAPFGLRWFAGVKVASGEDVFILSLQRTIAQGPFSSGDLRILADLSTRLAGAGAMARTLGFARAMVTLDAFQASGTAAILSHRSGDVFRVNAAAEALLGPDLQIRNGRLVATDRQAMAALDRALHGQLWKSDPGLSAPIVFHRSGIRPIVAYPLRLTSLARDIMAPASAAIVLVDLARRIAPAEETLRQIFGLTWAEAKLAIQISGGHSLSTSAEALGVTYETARKQLKAVFAKTETTRQGELVALANRLLPSRAASQSSVE